MNGGERALALCLLLPAAAVAAPGSPVAADALTTESTAAGVAALACAPAGLLLAALALRGRPLALGATWLLVALLALALGGTLRAGGDGLERTRALIVLANAFTCAAVAANLDPEGRRWLARGSLLLALLLLRGTLRFDERGYAGALWNTGELSNAALPGALAGAALAAWERGPWRWLGLATALCFVLHALLAPVLAALLVLAAVAGLAGLLRLPLAGGRPAALRLGALALAAAGALAWSALRPPAAGAPAGAPAAAARPAGDLGGIEVRARIWERTLAMTAGHLALGVGPGQFAVVFPAWRDPVEIELSAHRRLQEQEREVEHPHQDHLAFAAELGLAGAALWAAFALFVVARVPRALRAGDAAAGAFALGALGALSAACFNGALLHNPAASALAFAFFGGVLGPASAAPRPAAARAGAALVALVALGAVVLAPSLVRHGRALAAFATDEPLAPERASEALDAALAARPDSVTARTILARVLERTGAGPADVRAAWDEVLALRPLRFEALMQQGVHAARAGDVAAARGWFERALAVDPGHPGLLKNRVRLELEQGELERGLARLSELAAAGRADAAWLLDLGCELLLKGLDREAAPLLERAGERFRDLSGERALALAQEYERDGARLAADAFQSHAQRLWAREHAAAGRWDDARRLYHQCLRITRDYVEGAPARVRLELAAALWRSGRPEEARTELAGLSPTPADRAALPEWASAALSEIE